MAGGRRVRQDPAHSPPAGNEPLFVPIALLAALYVAVAYIMVRTVRLHAALKYAFALSVVPVFVALLVVTIAAANVLAPEWVAFALAPGRVKPLVAMAGLLPAPLLGSWAWYLLFRAIDRRVFGSAHTTPAAGVPTPSLRLDVAEPVRAGYARLFALRGIPVYVHWSLPAGAFVVSLLAGFDAAEAAYLVLGYVIVLAVHELGHAVAARAHGLEVMAIELSGIGGVCRMQVPPTVASARRIFVAGIVAQALLLALALAWVAFAGVPASPLGQCLVVTFVAVNALVLVLNLLPVRLSEGLPTDGRLLFELVGQAPDGPLAPAHGTVLPPETRLVAHGGFVPAGFRHGIELLNDATTPMDFVAEALAKHVGYARDRAIRDMLDAHLKGGLLIPLPDAETAARAAAGVVADARAKGYPLVCRAVSMESPSAANPR